jgi:predicted transposase YdaD
MDVCITEYNEKTFVNGIKEEGRIEGRVEGRAEGRIEGRAEGRIEGRILTLLEFKKTKEECILDIITKFHLTREEATEYFEKYAEGDF